MIRQHLDAIQVLLAPLAGTPQVFIGELDDISQEPAAAVPPPTPYVVVRPDSFPMASDRMANWSCTLQGRLYVTCVGASVAEAQWAQEKTRARLLDAVPVVAGRSVAPLIILDGQPLETDRDTTPPLLFTVDVYRYLTFPG